MKSELKTMSRKELEKLKADIDKALNKLKTTELKAAREAAAKAAAAHGFSLSELTGEAPAKKVRKTSGPKTKAAAKYRNPDDATKTWTGKGRQPDWFKTAVTSGKDPSTMEI